MQVILSDHNCEGQAEAILNTLRFDETWRQLAPLELVWFRQVGISNKAKDEEVWRLCQEQGFLLLTGNRSSTDKEVSLEFAIRILFTPNSLSVITIGNLKRVLPDPIYCKRCAIRLAEVVHDIEAYRGTMRLYIP